jgi:hypothetical protein
VKENGMEMILWGDEIESHLVRLESNTQTVNIDNDTEKYFDDF